MDSLKANTGGHQGPKARIRIVSGHRRNHGIQVQRYSGNRSVHRMVARSCPNKQPARGDMVSPRETTGDRTQGKVRSPHLRNSYDPQSTDGCQNTE